MEKEESEMTRLAILPQNHIASKTLVNQASACGGAGRVYVSAGTYILRMESRIRRSALQFHNIHTTLFFHFPVNFRGKLKTQGYESDEKSAAGI